MEHLYDIIIEGQAVHKGLSEESFFDVMSDLSTAHFEGHEIHPSNITYTTYIKE